MADLDCPTCSPRPRQGSRAGEYLGLRVTGTELVRHRIRTRYTWYVCEACAAEWTRVEDIGYGARDAFIERGHSPAVDPHW